MKTLLRREYLNNVEVNSDDSKNSTHHSSECQVIISISKNMLSLIFKVLKDLLNESI